LTQLLLFVKGKNDQLPEFQMKEKAIKRAIEEMFDASQAISQKFAYNTEKQ